MLKSVLPPSLAFLLSTQQPGNRCQRGSSSAHLTTFDSRNLAGALRVHCAGENLQTELLRLINLH